jgi:hypothetical protein
LGENNENQINIINFEMEQLKNENEKLINNLNEKEILINDIKFENSKK